MKNSKKIIITTILSLIVTIIIAELFGIYQIGYMPTILTMLYLVSIFSIILYVNITVSYFLKNRDKLTLKKIISIFLFFISLILELSFIVICDIAWKNYNSRITSSPFYISIIGNAFAVLVPSIISFLIGVILSKDK